MRVSYFRKAQSDCRINAAVFFNNFAVLGHLPGISNAGRATQMWIVVNRVVAMLLGITN